MIAPHIDISSAKLYKRFAVRDEEVILLDSITGLRWEIRVVLECSLLPPILVACKQQCKEASWYKQCLMICDYWRKVTDRPNSRGGRRVRSWACESRCGSPVALWSITLTIRKIRRRQIRSLYSILLRSREICLKITSAMPDRKWNRTESCACDTTAVTLC